MRARDILSHNQGFEPKVTIIIPVFNKASFLNDCLESVRKQSFKAVETICVDDCSTDESRSIILKYARLDPRVVLAQTPYNMGPGPARNLGMARATAQFVLFLDADDLLPPDALEILYDLARSTGSQLVRGSLANCSAGIEGTWVSEDQKMPDRRSFQLRDEPKLWLPYFFHCYLYSREFLLKNGIIFPALREGEDPVFLASCLVKVSSISTTSQITYIYRRDGSAGHRRDTLQHLRDFITHVELIKSLYFQSDHEVSWLEGCKDLYLEDVFLLMKKIQLDDEERKVILERIQKIWPLFQR
jgi:glycosyltransferase involved in cell wall biosynthesis